MIKETGFTAALLKEYGVDPYDRMLDLAFFKSTGRLRAGPADEFHLEQ